MSQNTQESLLGEKQQKEYTTQFSYEQLEKLAESALFFGNLKATDYNVGFVVHYLLKAEHLYKLEIGNLQGFMGLYAKYAVGHLKRERNKHKKEISFSVLDHSSATKVHYDTAAKPIYPEESELFSHIQTRRLLSKQQEAVIYRIFFLNESEKSIAQSLGVSIQNINNIKKRALEKLKCLKSELL